MTTATKKPDAEGKPEKARAPLGTDQLVESLAGCTSLRAAYTAGLSFLAGKFDAPYATMRLDVDNNSFEEHVQVSEAARASWARHCDGMMLSSRYHQTSQARFFRASGLDRTLAVLSVPLTNQRDGAIGAIALVVACDRRDVASARLSELHAVTAVIDLQAEMARRRTRPPADTSMLSKVAAHQSLQEFCFALTNSLKKNLASDQVSLGLVRGRSVKVACISGFDDLYPRSPGSRMIQQAMCECLDAEQIVCHQAESEAGSSRVSTGHHLHKQWYASLGASPVASVPLFVEDRCVAVLCLRNPGGSPFSRQQLDKVQELVTPMMPGLLLLERANRSAFQRAGESVHGFVRGFGKPGAMRKKVFAALLAVGAAWVAFGKTDYHLTVPCSIESTDDMQLSAPFEGAIAEALVQPGDEVVAGQVLARMDTKMLQAEREKLLSELRMAKVNTMRASQAGDVASAAQANAERSVAESRLTVVEQKLAAALVRAPSDGVILEGRLEPRIGAVVGLGEPLLRFAPRGRWKVNILVPENSAAELAVDQEAVVATSARPEVTTPLTIVQVHAASQVEHGKNVFTAEAEFTEAPPAWMRSGMQGIARVDVGRRPVWWVWAHSVIDSVRLQLWKL